MSHWEYPIDFKTLAADGIVAVIAKATQGARGVDKTYAAYKEAAAPHKFLWGSYHFGHRQRGERAGRVLPKHYQA